MSTDTYTNICHSYCDTQFRWKRHLLAMIVAANLLSNSEYKHYHLRLFQIFFGKQNYRCTMNNYHTSAEQAPEVRFDIRKRRLRFVCDTLFVQNQIVLVDLRCNTIPLHLP